MDIRDFLIGVLLFGLVATGVSNFMGEWAENAGGYNITNISNLAPVASVQAAVEDVETAITSSQITGTLLDIPITVISGLYSIVILIGITMSNVWTTFTTEIAALTGVPSWAVVLIQLIVIISVIFTVLKVLFNRTDGI